MSVENQRYEEMETQEQYDQTEQFGMRKSSWSY